MILVKNIMVLKFSQKYKFYGPKVFKAHEGTCIPKLAFYPLTSWGEDQVLRAFLSIGAIGTTSPGLPQMLGLQILHIWSYFTMKHSFW